MVRSRSRRSLVAMVCGLDLHGGRSPSTRSRRTRARSGEAGSGSPIGPGFRRWLREELGPRACEDSVALAVEGCTGWRYVVEEIEAAGFEAHLAEPAETSAARGPKRHAKTDRTDSQLLRELLQSGRLPESWIPPTPVLE